MTTPEMVERVARAICEADCGKVTPNELARCEGLAVAAIEAMRELPPMIANAAYQAYFKAAGGPQYAGLDGVFAAHRAMIDAALRTPNGDRTDDGR